MSSSLSSFLLINNCTFDFACPLYIAYVSVTLIGSVIIDNQSILSLIEAWLTVARDSLYRAETVYYKCKIGSAVVECLTRDRRATGSSLTGITELWSLSKTHLS